MWALGGEALDQEPLASAPRLYVEALNEMIDAQTVRVAALNNRVPSEILWFELVSASIALGLLAAYLALVGRGLAGVLIAAAVVPLCFSSARTSTGRLAARSRSPTRRSPSSSSR